MTATLTPVTAAPESMCYFIHLNSKLALGRIKRDLGNTVFGAVRGSKHNVLSSFPSSYAFQKLTLPGIPKQRPPLRKKPPWFLTRDADIQSLTTLVCTKPAAF